jgi:hypothetical protein
MDGTTVDYVVIPIVAVICLATWLAMVYWADAHPRKSPRTVAMTAEPDAAAGHAGAGQAAARATAGQVQQVDVPRQATAPPEDQGNGRGQVPASSARRGTS